MTNARGKLEESRGIEALAFRACCFGPVGVAHAASRWAVSRTSAIMLGMPWVRLALS